MMPFTGTPLPPSLVEPLWPVPLVGEEKHEPVEIPKGWDSGEGPVLRVFFTSFATQ